MAPKLKPWAHTVQIAYNGSNAPLGQRNDLDELVKLAREGGRKDYLEMFDEAPSLEEAKSSILDSKLQLGATKQQDSE